MGSGLADLRLLECRHHFGAEPLELFEAHRFRHTDGQADRHSVEAGKFYEENMKMFGELRLVRALSDEQIEIMRDPKRAPHAKLPRIEDAIANGGVLCGSPEQVIEHLKSLERRYPGLDHVSVSLSVGVPKSVCLEQLEWFGKEVMPEFQKAKVAEPAFAN